MKKAKRVLTGICTLALVITSTLGFAACGGKEEEIDPLANAVKEKVTNVYKTEEIKFPEGVSYVSGVKAKGDNLFFKSIRYDEEWNGTEYFFEYDSATKQYKETKINNDSSKDTYIVDYIVKDECIKILYGEYFSDPELNIYEDSYYLGELDSEGNIVKSVSLKDMDIKMPEHEDDGRWYPDKPSFSMFFEDTDGKIVLVDRWSGITAKLGDDNKPEKVLFMSEILEYQYIESLIALKDGCVLVGFETYNKEEDIYEDKLAKVNVTSGECKVYEDFDEEVMNNIYNIYPSSQGYDFVYTTINGIYGFNVETGKETEIVNFANSDLLYSWMYDVVECDGGFIATTYDDMTGSDLIVKLTAVPESDIKEKYIITLGGSYVGNSSFRRAIALFNQNSDEYRIKTVDYSEKVDENSEDTAFDILKKDVLAEKAPDIIVINQSEDISYLRSNGYLVDLYPLLTADADINTEDYFANYFEANKIDGKLYTLSPSFQMYSVAGKKANLEQYGNGWNMSEFFAFNQNLDDGQVLFFNTTRDELLSYFISTIYDTFVDETTGKCSFNTEDFKKFLTMIKDTTNTNYFDNIDYDDPNWYEIYDKFYSEQREVYANDGAMLMVAQLYDFYNYVNIAEQFKEDVTFIGVPSADKNGTSFCAAEREFAISSNSLFKEQAWKFIGSLLGDDYQTRTNGFPVKKSIFEKRAQEWLDSYKWMDEEDGLKYGNPSIIGSSTMITTEDSIAVDDIYEEYYRYRPTQKDVDCIKELISSATHVSRTYYDIIEIIKEEAEPFFIGQKTVDEVVSIIQSRLQVYISEKR